MKNLLTVLFICLISFLFGCYEPDSRTGIYTVITESDAKILFTDGDGNIKENTTAGGEWVYTVEIKEDVSPDPFMYEISVKSLSGPQDITITSDIQDNSWGVQNKDIEDSEELNFKSFYCAPWSTQCSKVTLHF